MDLDLRIAIKTNMKDTKLFDSEGNEYSAEDVFQLLPVEKVTRVEVIDQQGRSYINWDNNNLVELHLQDNGRTIKVFIYGGRKREK